MAAGEPGNGQAKGVPYLSAPLPSADPVTMLALSYPAQYHLGKFRAKRRRSRDLPGSR